MIAYLTRHTIVRYLLAGGTSAAINLAVLYVFNSILHLYYITASILAFILAFFVSWTFHKFWTFRDHSTKGMHKQGGLYLLSSLFGLSLNTLILYICVDVFYLPVLIGQIIAGALVASCTFFISKHIIFKKEEVHSTEEVLDTFL